MTRTSLGMVGAVAAVVMAAQPASARDGLSAGAAAAVGVIGGLAAGAAIGSAAAQPYYPGRQVGFAPPPPPVYAPPPPRRVIYEEVESDCFVRSRRFVNEWGDVVVRRQRVCD